MELLLKESVEARIPRINAREVQERDGQVGLLADWGVGAPGLSIKMEELVALGAKRFIAVGTAGSLMNAHNIADFVISPKALAEDGVAHLYLPSGQKIANADAELLLEWEQFAKSRALPSFKPAFAWSFSAIFRETLADVQRVESPGCSVVEMEAATLYAIGQEKNVQNLSLSLFVISDSITQDEWFPRIKDPSSAITPPAQPMGARILYFLAELR